MRIVLQRVTSAAVEVEGATCGEIGNGLLVLLGVSKSDSEKDVDYLVEKTLGLRIFPDAEGKMNRSVQESGGGLLVVSQFTLYGDCRKGRRPSFDQAAPPDLARSLYERFVEKAAASGIRVATGIFQAHMKVTLVNDGPVTLLYDSEKQI